MHWYWGWQCTHNWSLLSSTATRHCVCACHEYEFNWQLIPINCKPKMPMKIMKCEHLYHDRETYYSQITEWPPRLCNQVNSVQQNLLKSCMIRNTFHITTKYRTSYVFQKQVQQFLNKSEWNISPYSYGGLHKMSKCSPLIQGTEPPAVHTQVLYTKTWNFHTFQVTFSCKHILNTG